MNTPAVIGNARVRPDDEFGSDWQVIDARNGEGALGAAEALAGELNALPNADGLSTGQLCEEARRLRIEGYA
jgi:hypothetical protein